MPILPFGCRAFAVKPRGAYSRTRIEPRAWVGMNLGRSLTFPGAYHVWVPSVPRVVRITLEVYFDEGMYPRKNAATDAPTTTSIATPSHDLGADQPPGLPAVRPVDQQPQTPDVLLRAAPDAPQPAHAPRTVLLLFLGPYQRPDGIAVFLQQAGLKAEMLDIHPMLGGGQPHHDLLLDSVYSRVQIDAPPAHTRPSLPRRPARPARCAGCSRPMPRTGSSARSQSRQCFGASRRAAPAPAQAITSQHARRANGFHATRRA
eukprot:6193004-Pleurochrysis_carterae.AAC.4